MQTGNEFFGGRARLISIEVHQDSRGLLLPFDFDSLPFTPRRVFSISNVPQGEIRGRHAHKQGEQMLVCAQGQISVLMRHREESASLLLEPGSPALLLGPGVWAQQTYLSAGSVLLVLASHPFDPDSCTERWDGGEL
jgi:dTDP-4-dehydrorhamnose 3,5-epimerase-like enzyme